MHSNKVNVAIDAHDYLKRILLAPVYDVAVNTDLTHMSRLSLELGNQIWLKREDQQPVKSFKLRGAYNCLSQLNAAQLTKGIVTASAGNHAQGVAFSANKKAVNATIVMPETTPDIKIDAVKQFGGQFVRVVLHAQHHRAELLVHRCEVLVVVTQEVRAIRASGVVNLELGLHFIASGVLVRFLKPSDILLGARVHPVSPTLHQDLGGKCERRSEKGWSRRTCGWGPGLAS